MNFMSFKFKYLINVNALKLRSARSQEATALFIKTVRLAIFNGSSPLFDGSSPGSAEVNWSPPEIRYIFASSNTNNPKT